MEKFLSLAKWLYNKHRKAWDWLVERFLSEKKKDKVPDKGFKPGDNRGVLDRGIYKPTKGGKKK